MITKEQLLSAGYKPFTQSNIKKYTNSFWQKKFTDGVGRKYYITVAEFDNRAYLERFPNMQEYSYEPDVQFASCGVTFNTSMISPESIEQMEGFFESLWQSLSCDYYEVYHEEL